MEPLNPMAPANPPASLAPSATASEHPMIPNSKVTIREYFGQVTYCTPEVMDDLEVYIACLHNSIMKLFRENLIKVTDPKSTIKVQYTTVGSTVHEKEDEKGGWLKGALPTDVFKETLILSMEQAHRFQRLQSLFTKDGRLSIRKKSEIIKLINFRMQAAEEKALKDAHCLDSSVGPEDVTLETLDQLSAAIEKAKGDEDLRQLSKQAWIEHRIAHRQGVKVLDLASTAKANAAASRLQASRPSINDLLSPDLLFNTFKRLDLFETTKVRRVCKLWLQIIDEHKSFWRTLHLPEDKSREDSQSLEILELFDQKSGSTLQDVDFGARKEKKLRVEVFRKVFRILGKSKETLTQLVLMTHWPDDDHSSDLLALFNKLEYLKVITYRSDTVRLRRTSFKRDSQEDGSNTASPLRVLWYKEAGRSILNIDNARFKNLVSLDIGTTLSSSEWRTFLEGPSRNLKHLNLGFDKGDNEDNSGVPTLYLSNLEVLELSSGGRFPQWLLIPDSAKLIAYCTVSNLPSVSELWLWDSEYHRNDVVNRLPKLQTLCLVNVHVPKLIVEVLQERKANVEAGLHVDGVKMEMVKTVVLPFDFSKPDLSDRGKEILRGCRELVEVVEGDLRLLSRFIEVEY